MLLAPLDSYDGLIYAVQRFRYVRNVMLSGLALAYASVLVGAQLRGSFRTHEGLVAIWLAKAAMNCWRLAGLSTEIHLRLH